ncbi:MAG: tRNA pseudouridine(55) synthase TruB [Elusimicrobia bacterium GWC2_51_8]|nr:MAG: tRNA pseudouridine(55) synthase TruB [Elusimicrobia bacterium GWA2_51_34]OGR58168.1 MAG: tRNA pseudouridine(55) synthase TruB [Elusimicrobia bacterium GWC2_51_8]OGR87422.1 MAG: tRNA pseudouridine(55) synthase TruB [Elusimicrobia bacterium GWF2_52_66]HAF96100.1 tRNA pseudouridine(55) synthase TruB [Elusimicrobiota bacterium]HCE97473.1 tRNA pseudouridine(55) synthase TruB [Elusimicrobiota bacterium]
MPVIPPALFSGLFLFDKPKGITSHDAVDLLRHKLRLKRIGHGGTLDPMATGLLLLLVGSATKIQASLQGSSKVYCGVIKFGSQTDTWDAEGRVMAELPLPDLTEEAVKCAIAAFSGTITQQVPPFSAVRFQGRRLYAMARDNAVMPEIKREARVKWLSWELKGAELQFKIECSGGTYIRSIAHELGNTLGVFGHLAALRRESIGRFNVSDSITREAMIALSAQEIKARLIKVASG